MSQGCDARRTDCCCGTSTAHWPIRCRHTEGPMTTEEIFDVCDADDRVVGQARRSDVHARGLLHRAVHVFVFNSRGELLVQRRSANKDEYPLCLTSST